MNDNRPQEPKHYLVDVFLRILGRLIPASFRNTLVTLVLGVTPDVPVSLHDFPGASSVREAFYTGSILAFVFCFLGTLIGSLLAGTHFGQDPARTYFLMDAPNLVNYIVLCPLYVGLAATFIILVLQSWHRLYVRDESWSSILIGRRRLHVGVIIFLVLALSGVLTVQYIEECLNPAIYESAGWYVKVAEPAAVRSLGPLGVYYALLNFCLMFIGFLALFFIAPYLAVATDIGKALRDGRIGAGLSFEEFRKGLTEFTQSYIAVKLLTVVLMLNAYTWKWEKPIGSLNFIVLVAILSSIGVFIVSFPRYYVELEWYYFEVKRSALKNLPFPKHCDDLRSRRVRLLAHFLDIGFGVGFVWSIWA